MKLLDSKTKIDWKKVNTGAIGTKDYRTMFFIEFMTLADNGYDMETVGEEIAYSYSKAMQIARKAKGHIRAEVYIAYLDGYENHSYKVGKEVMRMETVHDVGRENLWEWIDGWN